MKKAACILLAAILLACFPPGTMADGDGWRWDGAWYYEKDGEMLTGFLTDGGALYYLDPARNGAMATGWKQVNGSWYWFDSGGKALDRWHRYEGSLYYMDPDTHIMATGLRTIGGAAFYFDGGGAMATGWRFLDGRWYYFTADGAMVRSGWMQIDGGWYWFDENGIMAADTAIGEYYVNKDGLLTSRSPSDGTPSDTAAASPQPLACSDWVAALEHAQLCDQLLIVAAEGKTAAVSFHTKDSDGLWNERFSVQGWIGAKGLGKQAAGDKKTPVGVYRFTQAFGLLPDPGSALPYTQADDTHWWVGDDTSTYYNQFVSTRDVTPDWRASVSERIVNYPTVYNYVLALDYNAERVPGKGSAIFVHCARDPGRATGGCVAIPEDAMRQLLVCADGGCAVIIDTPAGVRNY